VWLLLPPSEGKTTGGRGRPLRHRSTGDDPVSRARQDVVAALLKLVVGDVRAAAAALLLPDGAATGALAANAAVLDSPTTPALRRYAGVVYDGLDFTAMSEAEQRLARRCVLIFSGLLGVVRGDEPVPAYRVPAKAVLPGLGVASTFWRPVLTEVLPTTLRRGLVVDLRSTDYAAMWRPGRGLADRVVALRVLSPTPRGGHAVISYNSKLAKGRLAATLIRRAAKGLPVAAADDVAEAWLECGGADADTVADGRLALYSY
jgi:cytoplasmic iron level regulating protein YaaA (DUF328/UPF0246 family)